MQHRNWHCPKCQHDQYDADEFRATGGGFAKLFDVQNKRFTTVSCQQCHYTELYRTSTSGLGNVFDFLAGG